MNYIYRDFSHKFQSKIKKVNCSYYTTYIIDEEGFAYSTGRYPHGHANQNNINFFNHIYENTENRIFTDVFTNQNSAVLYAPIRVY